MRHHSKNRKFGREKTQRTALLRSLASSLVRDGKIITTEAKAKELRPYIEKLVTRGKKDGVHALRSIASRMGGSSLVAKGVRGISLRYAGRKGGYTRITKLPAQKSDGRKMAMIEFV